MSAETDFFDPNPVDAAQSVFIGEGDSLTTGAQWTPAIATAFPTWSVLNVATGGNTIADMQTQYAATVAPFYSAARGNNVVLMWGGTNDNTAGASAATIQSRTETYCNTATATGFQIIVVTMLPAASWDAARELVRTTFNTWLRANWQTFATAMVDIAAIPELADPNDTTYYSDGTHLTAAAYDLITPEFIQAIAGLPMVAPVLGTIAALEQLAVDTLTMGVGKQIKLTPAAAGFPSGALQLCDASGNQIGNSNFGHSSGGVWFMCPTETFLLLNSSSGAHYFSNIAGLTSTVSLNVGTGTTITRIKHGTAVLVTGTVTVSDATITANSRIFVNRHTDGGTVGDSYSITRSAGVSFTITSKTANATVAGDTSTVSYQIIEP